MQEPPLIAYMRHRLYRDLAALHPDPATGGKPRFVASILSDAYTNSSRGDLHAISWIQRCCYRGLRFQAAQAYERPFPAPAVAEAVEPHPRWVCSEAASGCEQLVVLDAAWQQGTTLVKERVLDVYGDWSWNSLTLSVLLQQTFYSLSDAGLDGPYRQLTALLNRTSVTTIIAAMRPLGDPSWDALDEGQKLQVSLGCVLRHAYAVEISHDFHNQVTQPEHMAECRNISSWYDSKQQPTALGASCRQRTQHVAAALAKSGRWSGDNISGSSSHAPASRSPPQESALMVFARKRLAAAAELAPAYAGLGRANIGPGQPEGYPPGH